MVWKEEDVMALAVGSLLEFAVRGFFYRQVWMNVWTYRIGIYPVAVSAAQLAEAYWQHVKTTYRNVPVSDLGDFFQEVTCRELDSLTGALGSYTIPSGERAGTRSPSGTTVQPAFMAAGATLAVATRVTRPGSKRFGGLCEGDVLDGSLTASPIAAIEALLAVAAVPIILGAPAALVELAPVVVRRDRSTGLPLANQSVESTSVDTLVTTQNTRKVGRGI